MAFLTLPNVNVNVSPLSGDHWRTMVCMAGLQGESHCSLKRTLLLGCSWLKITGQKPEEPEGFWKNVLCPVEMELSGLNMKHCVWRKENTEFQHKNLIPSVKHGVGVIMVWACLASGPGRLAIVDGTMNSWLYQQLKENVRTSVHELNVKRMWIKQQDSDSKHTVHSTKELLKKNKVNVLEWRS